MAQPGASPTRAGATKIHGRALAMMFGLASLIFWLWNTPLLYPLRVLVVFLHEISHGLAALLTGGSIVAIEVVAQEGGHCITNGGMRFATLSAGYLGSVLWGSLILILAARTRFDRVISAVLGVMLLVLSVLYVRPLLSFGFAFGVLASLGFLALARWASEGLNDLFLRVLGLTSCFYAVLDIKSDILDRRHLQSDAVKLAELTGIPAVVWGVLWLVIAMVAVALSLRSASSHPTKSSHPA